MAAVSRDWWCHEKFFCWSFYPQKFSRWPSKISILIGCGVLHMQLWHHNEGTYDIIKITHSPWGVRAMCQVSIFSLVRVLQRSKVSPFFQYGCHTTWPMTSYLLLKYSTRVFAPIVKISSQSDKRLFLIINWWHVLAAILEWMKIFKEIIDFEPLHQSTWNVTIMI